MIDGGSMVGGINVQLYLWAKELMRNGIEVYSLDSHAHSAEGIHFIKEPASASAAYLSFWFKAREILREIRPDFVLLRGSKSRNNFPVAYWCKSLGIKCVYMGASDKDFDFGATGIVSRFNMGMARRGTARVPFMLAQNEYQAARMKAFGCDNIAIFPNIWSREICSAPQTDIESGYYLWVANYRALKRPGMVLEIAKRCPDRRFVMIGAPYESGVYEECERKAAQLDNVKILGGKDFKDADSYFGGARALLCTSEYEGFPNTFLQAWCRDVPVLSTVDPNGLISAHNLGAVCNDVHDFVSAIESEMSQDADYERIKGNISRYFAQAHAPGRGFECLANLLAL